MEARAFLMLPAFFQRFLFSGWQAMTITLFSFSLPPAGAETGAFERRFWMAAFLSPSFSKGSLPPFAMVYIIRPKEYRSVV